MGGARHEDQAVGTTVESAWSKWAMGDLTDNVLVHALRPCFVAISVLNIDMNLGNDTEIGNVHANSHFWKVENIVLCAYDINAAHIYTYEILINDNNFCRQLICRIPATNVIRICATFMD